MTRRNKNNYGTLLIIVLLLVVLSNVVKAIMTLLPSVLLVITCVVAMVVYYKAKYKDTYLAKLATLKQLLIAVFTVAEVVCNKYHDTKLGAYKYPIVWLKHFLEGSGEAMKVPTELVQQANSALIKAMAADDYGTVYDTDTLKGKFCVNHSTLYEGRGFYGRPSLFYVMGGFTFHCYEKKNSKYIVSGNDYYDWHNNGDGNYFTSPLGDSKVMCFIIKVMGKLFGDDLFVTEGWPSGKPGISNKLWEEMYKVGAKSFHSYFCNVEIKVTEEEYDYIISGYVGYSSSEDDYDEEYDEEYDEDYDDEN